MSPIILTFKKSEVRWPNWGGSFVSRFHLEISGLTADERRTYQQMLTLEIRIRSFFYLGMNDLQLIIPLSETLDESREVFHYCVGVLGNMDFTQIDTQNPIQLVDSAETNIQTWMFRRNAKRKRDDGDKEEEEAGPSTKK